MNKVLLWTNQWIHQNHVESQFFHTIDSTNNFAKNIHSLTECPLFLYTQHQTKGRGRKNHTWINSDFMSTWTWKQPTFIHPITSILIGYFFYKSFQQVWPSSQWALKPPNDIYFKHQKVAGLLIEVLPRFDQFQFVIGIGVNVLKKPPYETMGCIADHHAVQKNQWVYFLNQFWSQIMSIKNQLIQNLSHKEVKEITLAIKRKKEFRDLLSMNSKGDLFFSNKVIEWFSL